MEDDKEIKFVVWNGVQYPMPESWIEAAYRFRKREYEEDDCRCHIEGMSEMVDGELTLVEFGMTYDQACSFTDEIVDMYERNHDCNLAENDMWDYTIENVLQRHSREFAQE